jgi:signal transduction histidine kinase
MAGPQAEILGQLLVIQQTLDVMSSTQSLASFLNEALRRVPGIAAVHLCVEGVVIPPDDEIARFCARCDKTQPHRIPPVAVCGELPGFSTLALGTARHHYGFLILTIADLQPVEPYWVFLENIANSVAQTLEIRAYIEKINQANTTLEQRVTERTRELALSHAELQRFAEVSAHHLQEPTRRLVAYAQRLRLRLGNRLEDEEALQALMYIEQSSVRMRDLVQDIEHYLSAGVPRGPVVMQDTALVLADLTQRLAHRLAAANATMETDTLPIILMDKSRLINLLEILLDNALVHKRPDTETHIRVSGGQREAMTYLRVEDNGPGIPEAYRQRVFEVFECLAVKPGGGTGIGLAVARRIVESQGGKIAIETSTLGGAAVVFELPSTHGQH